MSHIDRETGFVIVGLTSGESKAYMFPIPCDTCSSLISSPDSAVICRTCGKVYCRQCREDYTADCNHQNEKAPVLVFRG